MQIVGFSGYASAGKDSAAKPLLDEGWEKISFADPMREMAAAINPIVGVRFAEDDDAQTFMANGLKMAYVRYNEALEDVGYNEAKFKYPELRRFLQKLGTEGGRDILGENVWVDAAKARMDPDGRYVVTDVRFDNEVQAIHDLGGAVIRITRPGVGPASDHASEVLPELDVFKGDWNLNNDGTLEDLWATVQMFILDAMPSTV